VPLKAGADRLAELELLGLRFQHQITYSAALIQKHLAAPSRPLDGLAIVVHGLLSWRFNTRELTWARPAN
jgi:hypothetical protein